MIVDVFPFYNELEMLEYRLETLYPVVDKFVIVEGTHTFRGNPKELFYKNNKNNFLKFSDKIIHVVDDAEPDANPWVNERRQRELGQSVLSLAPNDIVMVCDVDEIPDPEVVKTLDTTLVYPIMGLGMDLYYYTFEYKCEEVWAAPTASRFFALTQIQSLNTARHWPKKPVIPNAGWHLSYFGDSEFIINKLKNFSHTEYSDVANSQEDVMKAMKNCENICDGTKFQYVPLSENTRLPPNYELLKTKRVICT